ncbi:MAG: helix-turn-helix domain-containing protein [Eubacterium sp.]
MDIGSKLQAARKAAGITQEQAAEALGISRQTLSNWENAKTYPDIVSVVKMSDLYSVSLDHLLKEEKPMSNYLDYLSESTNVVKSKNRQAKLALVLTYTAIWAASLLVFWFVASGSDAMAYSLVVLWILLPVTTLIESVIIGLNNYWGKLKWLAPLIFGVMYMLSEYASFSAANMISFDKLNLPDFSMILIGGAFSLVGIAAGAVACRIKEGKKK